METEMERKTSLICTFDTVEPNQRSYFRPRNIFIIAGILVILVAIIAITIYSRSYTRKNRHENTLVPPDPEVAPPSSPSKLRTFKSAAVCTDGVPCSLIGKSILERNGSAVDAAIAAMICNGLVNMQSQGIGGGFVMTIYERAKKQVYVLNARESAPAAANATMFKNLPNKESELGPLAVAVPGELAGYWEAHKRFGNLPWEELFKPTLELCETGFVITTPLYDGLLLNEESVRKDTTLKEIFVNPKTNDFQKPGSIVKPRALCETLRTIAANGAPIFYNGTIGDVLVRDLRKRGGIITRNDLKKYRVIWDEPLETTLSNGIKVFAPDLPASGALFIMILNVLDEFHFTPDSLKDINSTVLTYHRMLETFKFAFAERTSLGDKRFVDMVEITRNLTSKEYARSIRMKISDNGTSTDPYFYGSSISGEVEDHGTTHIDVIASNGDAVSVTSSINFYFGSGVVSERTGILLNNAMDDFGIPNKTNYFGIPPSPNNYIAPGKRSMSSMTPSILVNPDGNVGMTIGSSGGTKIISAMSQALAKILWMGKTVKEAVDDPRIHHQLFPMEISYEFGVPKPVIDGLKRLGHATQRYRQRGSVVCIIYVKNGTIYGNADYRKGGDVSGLN